MMASPTERAVTYLLDVNLLISLFDPMHVHHEAAHSWFAHRGQRSWATCPLTENGFVRVLSNPAYPNRSHPVREMVEALGVFKQRHPRSHVFWPDTVSLTDTNRFAAAQIQGHKQLTDVYLLGLCQAQGGVLATLDHRIVAHAVVRADDACIERVPR
ncbi:MAG: TA system VapC family ribonuclease toxin [Polyangiales bacterium]